MGSERTFAGSKERETGLDSPVRLEKKGIRRGEKDFRNHLFCWSSPDLAVLYPNPVASRNVESDGHRPKFQAANGVPELLKQTVHEWER